MRGIASRPCFPAERLARIGFVAVLVSATACGDHDGPAAEVTVADSAGITIVTNPSLAGLPRFETSSEPLVGIGVLEGDPSQQLHRVTGGLVLPGDTIVLLNGGSSEVRWYDTEGRFLRAQGKAGQGPGEYRSPSRIFRYRGDSLAVWDGGNLRLTVLASAGEPVRDAGVAGDFARAEVVGTFRDGSWVVFAQGFDPKQTEDYQDMPAWSLRYDAAGSPTGDTLVVDRWTTARYTVGDGFVEARGRELELAPARAVEADGYWTGEPRTGELRRHAPDGSGLDRIVRWATGDRTVTEAIEDAYVRDRLAMIADEEARRQVAAGAGSWEFAAQLPALAEMDGAADGRLWVQRFDRPGSSDPPTWWIFDPDGTAVREVRLPPESEPLWAEGDRVLLLLRDDLDVERVELRELRPAGEAERQTG